ncbi:GNAT family N-acetyltransferase [Fredinandcohnia sp. QZ13]|uniref:GNAT family N-acetyltransferase n=1 Tax=Fredinandcohnia sp. QZ13 TaxID=3073144 RepID=UPI002853165D|nr:GNAT family N-acetyltransferase [Fredinandcohnia sp. QZ13]MDR4886845.1 GNAT family N-acetyltransferase [Fredinandcohnia sp. QZ13]
MAIERMTEDRFMDSVRLSEYAFQYKVSEEQQKTIFKNLKKHQIYGIYENSMLAAKFHLIPLATYVGEQSFKMGGIAGVATYPEYRRKGYVKELLTYALETMNKQGFTVSMLHPFDVSFYRKYGWELFSNRLKTVFQRSDLVMLEPVEGSVKRYLFENVNLDELKRIYDQYASQFSGMLVREDEWWKSVVDDLHIAIYYDASEQPIGYILYESKDNKMTVEEFVTINYEARRGLWNFICQHDSMISELEMITNEKEPLFFSLKKQKTVKREVLPYFMVRIVDVESFLKEYKFAGNETLRLQISDPFATWNEKTFLVIEGEVRVVNETEGSLKLSINALSAAFFGHKRPTELFAAGMIEGAEQDIEAFEKMIPNRDAYIYDFF